MPCSSSSSSDSASAFDEFDEESQSGYKPGGYHRVSPNDHFQHWTVSKKLGWGHFSTVHLVSHIDSKQVGALKIQKSAPHYFEAAQDEIDLLTAVLEADDTEFAGKRFVVKLLDSFSFEGPNGLHPVMVFDVLGDNLLTLVKAYDYKGIPLPLVKQITWQICAGLDVLHRQCSIIHCDLKLENILIAGMAFPLAKELAKKLPGLGNLAPVYQGDISPLLEKKQVILTKLRVLDLQQQEKKSKRVQHHQEQLRADLLHVVEQVQEEKVPLPAAVVVAENNESSWEYVVGKGESLNEEQLARSVDLFTPNFRFSWVNSSQLPPQSNSNNEQEDLKYDAYCWLPLSHLQKSCAFDEKKDCFVLKDVCTLTKSKRRLPTPQQLNRLVRFHSLSQWASHPKYSIKSTRGGQKKEEWELFHISPVNFAALARLESLFRISFLVSTHSLPIIGTRRIKLEWDCVLLPLSERLFHPDSRKSIVYLGKAGGTFPCNKLTISLCDLGNACLIDNPVSEIIQTRQYRAPEVIQLLGYQPSCDTWSLACVVFELLTGEFLFNPESKSVSRDVEHLALVEEMLGGPPPLRWRSPLFYDSFGKLQGMTETLEYRSLDKVLVEDYGLGVSVAPKITSFLLPLLNWCPEKRPTMAQCLTHPFLSHFVK